MSWFSVAILVIGAVFIASRLVRLVHLGGTLRSVPSEQQSAEAELRAHLLAEGGADGDDAQAVGVALALALREAEAEANGREVDSPL